MRAPPAFTRNAIPLYILRQAQDEGIVIRMAVEVAEKTGGTRLCGDAAEMRDGRAVLIGGICKECDNQTFPSAPVCCVCMSEAIQPQAMPRIGTLYAFSTVHVAAKKWKKPMRIGLCDLHNGARVVHHLNDASLEIGDAVETGMGIVGEDENGPIETFVFRRAKP